MENIVEETSKTMKEKSEINDPDKIIREINL